MDLKGEVVKRTHLDLSVKCGSTPTRTRIENRKRKGVGVRCSISFQHCMVESWNNKKQNRAGEGREVKLTASIVYYSDSPRFLRGTRFVTHGNFVCEFDAD